MLRIAFITELFPPHVGGQEFRFFRLARLLGSTSKVKVYVYTIRHQDNLPEYEELEGIPVHRYTTLTNYVRPGTRAWIPLLNYIIQTRCLLKAIHSEFDILFVNEMPIAHLYIIPKYKNLVVDFCEIHGTGFSRFLIADSAKKFKFATSVSDFVASSLKNWKRDIKVEVIRTPLDILEYQADPKNKESRLVLYVGRLAKHKNVLNLVKAIIRLHEIDRSAKWKLIVAGRGSRDIETYISKVSSKYGFIEYLGYVDESEKRKLYKRAWLFAIPSTREGFPNAAAEAIASNTPVLTIKTSNNGLWYDIIKHKVGIVCSNGTPEALVNCMMKIEEDVYFELVKGCAKMRTEFDESHVYRKLMCFFSEVVNHEKT